MTEIADLELGLHQREAGRGIDAALVLVGAKTGRFRYDARAALPERTLRISMTELLLEASRQLDEGGR